MVSSLEMLQWIREESNPITGLEQKVRIFTSMRSWSIALNPEAFGAISLQYNSYNNMAMS